MTDKAISPLRQRMIEDMTIRKFASKTQHDYLQRVKNFTAYLGRSPDTDSSEDLWWLMLLASVTEVSRSTGDASHFDLNSQQTPASTASQASSGSACR